MTLLVVLVFLGEYSVQETMVEPPLRYDGMGRDYSPIALYNPSTGSEFYIPASYRGRFVFEFNGMTYEIIRMTNSNIQVYRREP